jgi:hypothetical protein
MFAASIGLAACGSSSAPAPAVPSTPAVPRAKVRIDSASCVEETEARARLIEVLVAHHAEQSALIVDVVTSANPGGEHELQLRVIRERGDVGLDRRYVLGPGDCGSAAELLALSVDRFLNSFPEWADPVSLSAPEYGQQYGIDLLLISSLSSIWLPFGVDAQLGALADFGGTRNRLGGSVLVRASVPQRAGSGSFQQTAFLAGVSWRHRRSPWELRVELRGGALLVSGIGFAENDSDWLPWWEAVAFAGRTFSWGSAGFELAGSVLRHRAVTRDRLVSEDIASFRMGLAGSFELFSQKP